jgi:hypothetical protein
MPPINASRPAEISSLKDRVRPELGRCRRLAAQTRDSQVRLGIGLAPVAFVGQALASHIGMATAAAANTFLQRLLGAAALDAAIYEEVEADRSATGQAFVVVVLSSFAAGIGARGFGGSTVAAVVFFTIVSLLAWAAWALVTFEIGVRLMPESGTRSDPGELLRTIGFSTTPGLLRFFGVLPGLTTPVFFVSSVWMLATMIVAVRQALDYRSTGRAVAVCVLGWVMALAIAVVLGVLFAPTVR